MAGGLVEHQYNTADPLQVRQMTHARYSERPDNVHAECHRLLRLKGDEAIVDIGCGPGNFVCGLRAAGHKGRLVGLDNSAGMIATARQTAETAGLDIAWVIGDSQQLSFTSGSFDWAAVLHMLYHVPDMEKAVAEAARVANQGALFSTNAKCTTPYIHEVRQNMLATFGGAYTADTMLVGRFCVENARSVLSTAFQSVDEVLLHNALVFTSPAPIIDYLETSITMYYPTAPGQPLYETIRQWLAQEVAQRFAEMDGMWRDPKIVGLYLCRR